MPTTFGLWISNKVKLNSPKSISVFTNVNFNVSLSWHSDAFLKIYNCVQIRLASVIKYHSWICVSVRVWVCVECVCVIIKTQSNGSRPIEWILPSARCGSPSKIIPVTAIALGCWRELNGWVHGGGSSTCLSSLANSLPNKQAFFPFPILSLSWHWVYSFVLLRFMSLFYQ